MIVKLKVARNQLARFALTGVVVYEHFFIVDGAPKSLQKDIVQGALVSIYRYLQLRGQQRVSVLRTCEVTALITIPDFRRCLCQRALRRAQDKGQFERLIQFPTDDTAQPAANPARRLITSSPREVGCTRVACQSPRLIRSEDTQILQQIRVNLVCEIPLAQIGSGRNARSPHFTHTCTATPAGRSVV